MEHERCDEEEEGGASSAARRGMGDLEGLSVASMLAGVLTWKMTLLANSTT